MKQQQHLFPPLTNSYSQGMDMKELAEALRGPGRFEALPRLSQVTEGELPSFLEQVVGGFEQGDGFVLDVLREVSDTVGVEELQACLVLKWPEFSGEMREKLALGTSALPLSDDALLGIFSDPENSTRVRHFLASNYFQMVKHGRNRRVLAEMVAKVGTYGVPEPDAVLERFKKNAWELISEGEEAE